MKPLSNGVLFAASVISTSTLAYPIIKDVHGFDIKLGSPSYRAFMTAKAKTLNQTEYRPRKGDYYYWLDFDPRGVYENTILELVTNFDNAGGSNSVGIAKVDVSFSPYLKNDAETAKQNSVKDIPVYTASCGVNAAGQKALDLCFARGAIAGQFQELLFKDSKEKGAETYTIRYSYSNTVTDDWTKVSNVVKKGLDLPVFTDVKAVANTVLEFVNALKELTDRGSNNDAEDGVVKLRAGGLKDEDEDEGASAMHIYKPRTNGAGFPVDKDGKVIRDTPLSKARKKMQFDTKAAREFIAIRRTASKILDRNEGTEISTLDILTDDVRKPNDAFKAAFEKKGGGEKPKDDDKPKKAEGEAPADNTSPPTKIDFNGPDKDKINSQLMNLCDNMHVAMKGAEFSNLDSMVLRRSYLFQIGGASAVASGPLNVKNKCWSQEEEYELREVMKSMKITFAKGYDTFGDYKTSR